MSFSRVSVIGDASRLRMARIRGDEKETTMAQFLGDLAFLFELFAAAAGLLVLHRAASEAKPMLLRAAGWLLIAGGVGGAACTGYYWLHYQQRGDFDAAHGAHDASTPMSDMPMRNMPTQGAMHR